VIWKDTVLSTVTVFGDAPSNVNDGMPVEPVEAPPDPSPPPPQPVMKIRQAIQNERGCSNGHECEKIFIDPSNDPRNGKFLYSEQATGRRLCRQAVFHKLDHFLMRCS